MKLNDWKSDAMQYADFDNEASKMGEYTTIDRDDLRDLEADLVKARDLLRRIVKARHHEQPGVLQEIEDHLATSNPGQGK